MPSPGYPLRMEIDCRRRRLARRHTNIATRLYIGMIGCVLGHMGEDAARPARRARDSAGWPRSRCAAGQEGARVPRTGAADYKCMPHRFRRRARGPRGLSSLPAPRRSGCIKPAPSRRGPPAASRRPHRRRGRFPSPRAAMRAGPVLGPHRAAPPSPRLVVSLPLAGRAAPLPDARPRCCAGQRRASLGSLRPVWRREVPALTRPRPSAPRSRPGRARPPRRPLGPIVPPGPRRAPAPRRAAQAPYV